MTNMKLTHDIISLGGDPEFFIYKKNKSKPEIISADKILPPKNNKLSCDSGKIFFDGVQAEINPYPSDCREIFCGHIRNCMLKAYVHSTRVLGEDNALLVPLASVEITPDVIKDADMECTRFGCSPDFNIYSNKKIKYPDGHKFMTRFSGGHIHLGFRQLNLVNYFTNPKNLENVIRALDYLVGTISVAISPYRDEYVRKKYYGKAGTYRIQPHGIEYRTLSSFWIVSPILTSLITSMARDAVTLVRRGKAKKYLFDKVDSKEIVRIINQHDVEAAKMVYKNVIKPLYSLFKYELGVPMTLEPVVKFVDELVKYGYRHFFNPLNTIYYWDIAKPGLQTSLLGIKDFDYTYGVYKFAIDYMCNLFTAEELRTLGE